MLVNCDKCGGKTVLARVGIVPEGLSITGLATTKITPVEAHVCIECGYIGLYAQDPRGLQSAPHEQAGKAEER